MELPSLREVVDSAVGENWKAVVVAFVAAYAVAAVFVFRYPSPFAARVGGRRTGTVCRARTVRALVVWTSPVANRRAPR